MHPKCGYNHASTDVHVKPLPSPPFLVRVIYDYTSKEQDELDLTQGQVCWQIVDHKICFDTIKPLLYKYMYMYMQKVYLAKVFNFCYWLVLGYSMNN